MNKTAIAVAVAGALAAPVAMAQGSTVQIGGSLHLIYGLHNPHNPSAASKHDNMHQSEPEIRVRGEEKLGGGLSVWFQCTSSFDVVGTQAQTNSAGWCGRNSGIGFKGGWGNLFAGTWDTPHKLNFNQARGWFSGTNVFGGTATLLYSGSQSNVGNAGASFYRRQSRTWNYHSPSWGGFSVNGAVSASNEQAAIPETPGRSPRLYSVAGMYRGGPLYVGLSYEQHQDFRAVGNGGDDDSINLVGVYTFANAIRLSAVYARNDYENVAVVGDSVKTRGWATYLDWRIAGPHSLKAQYGRLRDVKGTLGTTIGNFTAGNSTGGKVYGIDYAYDFSKRTQGYLGYARMKNDGNTNAFDQGIADATLGGKQTFMGLGLRHRF
jgi:predicted porin